MAFNLVSCTLVAWFSLARLATLVTISVGVLHREAQAFGALAFVKNGVISSPIKNKNKLIFV